MDVYKKDFENAVEMIDWQNKMLKQQADEIVKLKLEWQYMATKLEEYSLLYGAK